MAAYSLFFVGSFVVLLLEMLWGNGGNVLLPLQVAILVGLTLFMLHILVRWIECFEKRDITTAILNVGETLVFVVGVVTYENAMVSFSQAVYVLVVPLTIMPLELRAIATIAVIALAFFFPYVTWPFLRKAFDGFMKARLRDATSPGRKKKRRNKK